ncbi:MAG: potassium-transporting ATPase subunit KdpA [Leptospiraceae bacterium]|nr:potassium-transporting ATPase subunit KdpA [Leptospiraceae bacterium]
MTVYDTLQIFIYLFLLIILSPVLGFYLAKVYEGKKTIFSKILEPLENGIYRISGIDKNKQAGWIKYTKDLLLFNGIGFTIVLLLLLFQKYLPLNPENLDNLGLPLALNTTISFMTNTNWQAYSGENTMSYASQMLGLNVQNFLSASTGMAVLIAITRAFSHRSNGEIGNFGVDLTRSIVYALLPLSIILSILLLNEGVVQSFSNYIQAITLEGNIQVVPQGPAASQIAIKQLGTNGGGFFGVNSAHPFENPTPFSNLLQMLSILLIPSALTFTYGKMTGNLKQGFVIFGVMSILFLSGLGIALFSEFNYTPIPEVGASLEGKELRFGITNSILWGTATTSASNGSVNAMHDSFSPLAGLVMILNIMMGEIIFGGVGAGLYGMILFVILTVFIAGLMVGRTPEYLGKKIEAREIKFAMLGVLLPSICILFFSGISVLLEAGLNSRNNLGPHGLTEILYAFSSASGNNGSAFAGLNANTNYYNLTLGFCMLAGRFGVIIPILAIAGSISVKKQTPVSSGTFQTDSLLFMVLLISIILIVGALTFFPALLLGPILEHFLLTAGHLF